MNSCSDCGNEKVMLYYNMKQFLDTGIMVYRCRHCYDRNRKESLMNNCSPPNYDNNPPFLRKEYNNPDNLGNGEPLYDSQETKQKTTDSEVVKLTKGELSTLINQAVREALVATGNVQTCDKCGKLKVSGDNQWRFRGTSHYGNLSVLLLCPECDQKEELAANG